MHNLSYNYYIRIINNISKCKTFQYSLRLTTNATLRGRSVRMPCVESWGVWKPASACIPTTWPSPGTRSTGAEAPSLMSNGCLLLGIVWSRKLTNISQVWKIVIVLEHKWMYLTGLIRTLTPSQWSIWLLFLFFQK